MYKKVKVVMIPTEDKTAPIGMDDSTRKLFKFKPHQALWGYQHLYFLSEEIGDVDNINAGEWVLNPDGYVDIFGYDYQACYSKEDILKCRKVIATTNRNNFDLPQIPKDFVEEYINAYNSNNTIETVGVEYDMVNINHGTNFAHKYVEELKVDKNRTVQVKTKKDEASYTKEQLSNVLNDLAIDAHIDADYLNWWIKENI